jgi:hypothetical protein
MLAQCAGGHSALTKVVISASACVHCTRPTHACAVIAVLNVPAHADVCTLSLCQQEPKVDQAVTCCEHNK